MLSAHTTNRKKASKAGCDMGLDDPLPSYVSKAADLSAKQASARNGCNFKSHLLKIFKGAFSKGGMPSAKMKIL